MSSDGEIKMSLREMICQCESDVLHRVTTSIAHTLKHTTTRDLELLTFSCRRCLSSFNSRYVLLASTGVENGFMIFFIATSSTDWPDA